MIPVPQRPKELLQSTWQMECATWPANWQGSGRALASGEIEQLKRQACRCSDWPALRCETEFLPSGYHNIEFMGACFLSTQRGETTIEGVSKPCGLSNATLHEVWVGPGVFVRDCFLLSRLWISEACQLVSNGRICGTEKGWAQAWTMNFGNELGGRPCEALPELTLAMAEYRCQKGLQDETWASEAQAVWQACAKPYSICGRGVRIFNTPLVRDVFLGAYTCVDSALRLEQVVSLSVSDEPVAVGAGAQIKQAILQWGSKVVGSAQVNSSIVGEQSSVENAAMVESSYIGPNNHLGKGEVTACLLGPFVGLHHQSLLIGVVWPEGRGNVGYGANIGSNHTGKAPDQEFFPGEGCFFGIGTTLKFPAHLRKSPYSIFSSGVTVLAQKVEMPFSLINSRSELEGGSPALNEIFPGWVLGENLYALLRNELKFKQRNKARRFQLDPRWLREDTALLMLEAWQNCSRCSGRAWYDARHLPELGKNVLSEGSRLKAVELYGRFITFFALGQVLGLGGEKGDLQRWPAWLAEQGLPAQDMAVLKQLYGEELRRQALDISASKAKDFTRGRQIIADYDAVHPSLESDPVVLWAEKRYKDFV